MFEHISIDTGSPVTRLVLDRPERRNALSLALMREMLAALDQIAADASTRVVVIEGRARVERHGRHVIGSRDNQVAVPLGAPAENR